MLNIVPYDPSHLENYTMRERELKITRIMGDFELHVLAMSQHGELVSIIDVDTNKTLTIGGVVPIFHNVADLFMFPSQDVPEYTLDFSKTVKKLVDRWSSEYVRLQSVCLNDELHNRWMKFLGLEKEGVMPLFGPDLKDYAMFSKIRSNYGR